MTKIPPYLKKGDTVGITCPASKMEYRAAEFAAEVVEQWGLKVKIGITAGTAFHNFAADDDTRLRELQEMLDDENIQAILFGRGGYGVIRIMDRIDFTRFVKHPKWLCGYSDITALHTHIYQRYHIASLHSMMCSGITAGTFNNEYVKSLQDAISGKQYLYQFTPHPLNRTGICTGELTGGNLSLLANLSGTVSQPDTAGKILFIEEIGEYRYGVDRMMYNLKRAGWLDHLSGLIAGAFTDPKETETPFGQTEYEIIRDKVKEYDYPVCFGFPAGHQVENYALKTGVEHELSITEERCMLAEKINYPITP